VQQDPLVGRTDLQDAAYFCAAQPLKVAQGHHLPLPGREILDSGPDAVGHLGRPHPVVGVLGPVLWRRRPLARLVEPSRVDGRFLAQG